MDSAHFHRAVGFNLAIQVLRVYSTADCSVIAPGFVFVFVFVSVSVSASVSKY